ncbi:hypothetical protein [Cellulomonas hominis]
MLGAKTYKRRNGVERSFALTKQWRGLATSYDKLAITCRAAPPDDQSAAPSASDP